MRLRCQVAMEAVACRRNGGRPGAARLKLVFPEDFDCDLLVVSQCRCLHQITDRLDRLTVLTDDAADIIRIEADLEKNDTAILTLGDDDFIRILHESVENKLEKLLQAATGAALALRMMEPTVMLGWAPLEIQYSARSTLIR